MSLSEASKDYDERVSIKIELIQDDTIAESN